MTLSDDNTRRYYANYLVTISCQQKTAWVSYQDIYIVRKHLEACGVKIEKGNYENHGLYGQLHWHGLVVFHGKYSPLTKWGELDHGKTFRIDFKRIRRGTIFKLLAYISKQQYEDAPTLNMFKKFYYNQDSNQYEDDKMLLYKYRRQQI